MKLLVVDTDPRSVKALDRILKDEYVIDVARTAEQAEHLTFNSYYDLVILDLVLPDMDGEDLCRILKARFAQLPILVLTKRSMIADKEKAFDYGADDFIEKPFSVRELRARMRALTRRNIRPNTEFMDIMRVGDLVLNRASKSVTYKSHKISLRRKELQLLEFMLLNKGKVMTRGEILEHVWDSNISPFTNTVDVHMKRLRDKIEKPFGENVIVTIHGIGYMIEAGDVIEEDIIL